MSARRSLNVEREMRLSKTYESDDEARKASSRGVLKAGRYSAQIREAVEKPDRHGNDMIEFLVAVFDPQGAERLVKDWLTTHDKAAAKVRSCASACNLLDRYEANELSQDDFPGHDVQVKITVEKRRGFPDQNRIELYYPAASASSSVVTPLRSAV
jgi:hypothetical protein